MRLIADENVDRQIVDVLRIRGHEVRYVCESAPGISDGAVLELARSENRVLLTADKDFGELVFRQGRAARGVILVRLQGYSPQEKSQRVLQAFLEHCDEFEGAFSVIGPKTLRIRRSMSHH